VTSPLAWMSKPTSVVPEAVAELSRPVKHLGYQRIYETHGALWAQPAFSGSVPTAAHLSAEGLAEQAFQQLVVRTGIHPRDVSVFVDCRSGAMIGGPAPTYRLALSIGARGATPVCLWGQDGPEIVLGISVATRRLLQSGGVAVLSACQRVVSPDTRTPDWTALMLGDGASSVLLSRQYFQGGRPILASEIGSANESFADVQARACARAGIASNACAWLAAVDPTMCEVATWRSMGGRSLYFGVADPLITLAEVVERPEGPETGALQIRGRGGTTGVVIIGDADCDG
jgi:hypothetical protein